MFGFLANADVIAVATVSISNGCHQLTGVSGPISIPKQNTAKKMASVFEGDCAMRVNDTHLPRGK